MWLPSKRAELKTSHDRTSHIPERWRSSQTSDCASPESVARQRHPVATQRSAVSSHCLSPCQSAGSPSKLQSPLCRWLADRCIEAYASRARCFTRWDSKRVCFADGRRWHWYRSHGATELSFATPRRSVNRGHIRSTLSAEDLSGLVDLSGRHSGSRGLL